MDDLLDPVLISAPSNAEQFIVFDIAAHASEVLTVESPQYAKVAEAALDYAYGLGYSDIRYAGTELNISDSPSGRCYRTTFTFEAM